MVTTPPHDFFAKPHTTAASLGQRLRETIPSCVAVSGHHRDAVKPGDLAD
jgi:hypothetical protein